MLRHRITNLIFLLKNRNFSVSSSFSTDKQNVPSYKQLSEVQKQKLEEDKQKLIWRTKPLDQPYAFKSKFNVFGGDELEPRYFHKNYIKIAILSLLYLLAHYQCWYSQ